MTSDVSTITSSLKHITFPVLIIRFIKLKSILAYNFNKIMEYTAYSKRTSTKRITKTNKCLCKSFKILRECFFILVCLCFEPFQQFYLMYRRQLPV